MLDFPKKIGFVGGQQVNRHLHLFGVLARRQQLEILTKALQLMRRQALAQTPGDQCLFGVGHGDAGGFKNKTLELGKFSIGNRLGLQLKLHQYLSLFSFQPLRNMR